MKDVITPTDFPDKNKSFYADAFRVISTSYEAFKYVPNNLKINSSAPLYLQGMTAGDIKKRINPLYEWMRNAKVFQIRLEEMVDKSFPINSIHFPYEEMFLELDRPIETRRGVTEEVDYIRAFLIKTAGRKKSWEKVPKKERGEFYHRVTAMMDRELEVVLWYQDYGYYSFFVSVMENGSIVITDSNEDIETHFQSCPCMDAMMSKVLQSPVVSTIPKTLFGEELESNANKEGKTFLKHKRCHLRNFEMAASMIYTIISAINQSEIKYIEGEALERYEYHGHSPIAMTVSLKGDGERKKYESTGLGTKHRYQYDVRGHFRKFNDGRTVWIESHRRGVESDSYIKKDYVLGGSITMSWWRVVKGWFFRITRK